MSILHFHSREQLIATSWHERLRSCDREQDVVAVAREFTAMISPEEIVTLPPQVIPHKLVDAEDVTSFAFALARLGCDAGQPEAPLVRKMAEFFRTASIRLSTILSQPDAGDSRQSA